MSARLLALSALLALPAQAAPRELPLTWTTRTTAKGAHQLEAWVSPRIARTDDFLRLDTRFVWSRGVTSSLDTQLSLDFDVERTDFAPERFEPRASTVWRWTTWRSAGSVFAAGGLGRFSLGVDTAELEARLLLDVTLGRVLLAANAAGSHTFFWSNRTGIDTRLEGLVAARFAVSSVASFGVEFRAKSSYREALHQGTAYLIGPTLTFTWPALWVTLGGYAQVAADKATADKGTGEPATLRDDERFLVRLAFGFKAE